MPATCLRIDQLGDDPRAVLIRHHYVFALYSGTRAIETPLPCRRKLSLMANRLGDSRSKAYALAGEILVSTISLRRSL